MLLNQDTKSWQQVCCAFVGAVLSQIAKQYSREQSSRRPKISGMHSSEHMCEHAGAVAYLAPLVLNQDPKLKRQVCCALAQIAKHSVDMAEVVVEAEVFPKILTCLKFPDELVRKHAATVVREVSYVTPSRTV